MNQQSELLINTCAGAGIELTQIGEVIEGDLIRLFVDNQCETNKGEVIQAFHKNGGFIASAGNERTLPRILLEIGFRHVELFTNNPITAGGFIAEGLKVTTCPLSLVIEGKRYGPEEYHMISRFGGHVAVVGAPTFCP